jgi:hypothetical protein
MDRGFTVLITSGKGDVHADKELMDEKKMKGMCMLEKVEVLDNLKRGMRITAVRIHHKETIQ